jgi:hypothetical protein
MENCENFILWKAAKISFYGKLLKFNSMENLKFHSMENWGNFVLWKTAKISFFGRP